MKKIRKGNDITVTWSIYDKDTGIAYDLEGRNITLYAGHGNNMHPVPFTIDGNNVIWHFAGKDQEEIGTYSLILVENEGSADMRTIDVCNAFLLVSHTCACIPSQDDENVETETVELASEITPVEGGVGIGEPTATAESVPYYEEATVTVESSGSVSARVFSFHFEIPEGKPGQDGQNGKDGEQGHTPIVGVAKYTDGIYYWTVDGTWLKDSLGAMVSAQGYDGADGKDGMNGKDGKDGADGRDGITPKLKIENGYWYVSYDNGSTWTQVGAATSGGSGGTNISIDTALSITSTNAVQNKVITTELNKKGTYSKPSTGIPKSDLANDVQESLGKADTALQSFEERYKGTVTSVKINGSTKNPDADGVVDLGIIEGGEGVSGDYLPTTGGTVNGSVTINGVLRPKSVVSVRFWDTPDLDDVSNLNSGLEVRAVGLDHLNIPNNAHPLGSVFENLNYDSNTGNQVYYSTYTNDVFYRSRFSGSWRNWRRFAFLDSDSLSPASGRLTVNGEIKANDYLDAYGISLYETFATKTELGDINAVLDAINGEVI